MTSKEKTSLFVILAIALLALHANFDLLEKYNFEGGGAEKEHTRQEKRHTLKGYKPHLPIGGFERIVKLFFVTIQTLTGMARIAKPTIQTISGVSRIVPCQPKTIISEYEIGEQNRLMNILMGVKD